jgi:secondary thiamine-phosphate synthase enzyme
MRQRTTALSVRTKGPGLYDITGEVERAIEAGDFRTGLATCFLRHTSASLVIQENADSDVLSDLEDFMRRAVSRDPKFYRHNTEGADDMPAHIRAALTATSLSIPIADGRMVLGTWQAIYVFEHRDASHTREIVVHVIGE